MTDSLHICHLECKRIHKGKSAYQSLDVFIYVLCVDIREKVYDTGSEFCIFLDTKLVLQRLHCLMDLQDLRASRPVNWPW